MQAEVDAIYSQPAPREAYTERDIVAYTQHLGYEDESFPNSTNDGDVSSTTQRPTMTSYDFPGFQSPLKWSNNVSEY
jgi:hypothetical protein